MPRPSLIISLTFRPLGTHGHPSSPFPPLPGTLREVVIKSRALIAGEIDLDATWTPPRKRGTPGSEKLVSYRGLFVWTDNSLLLPPHPFSFPSLLSPPLPHLLSTSFSSLPGSSGRKLWNSMRYGGRRFFFCSV